MQESEFEKNIQQKMEELNLTPSASVWNKVELSLPEKEKPGRWIFFLLLFGFLAGGALLLWNNNNNNNNGKEKIVTTKNSIQKNNAEHSVIRNEKTNQTFVDSNSSFAQKQNVTTVNNKSNLNSKNVIVASSKTNSKRTNNANNKKTQAIVDSNSSFAQKQNVTTVNNKNSLNSKGVIIASSKTGSKASKKTSNKTIPINTAAKIADEGIAIAHRNQYKTKQKTHVKIKIPVATGEEEKNNEMTNDVVSADTIKDSSQVVISAPIQDKPIGVNKEIENDSSTIIKKDTSQAVTKAIEKKRNNKKWKHGIEAALGLTNVKSNLFNTGNSYLSAVTGPFSGPPVFIAPSSPTQSLAVGAGFFIEKELTNHWKFTTGFNYVYQSSLLNVGAKEDSGRTFRFANSSVATTQGYYLTGNTSTYKNNFHLLEIPLFMEYKFSKKTAFYLQGGTTIDYLLQSNALIYNAGYNEYFTHKELFNKLLLSITAGAGVSLAQKTKLPFSVGYRFKYSFGSIIKPSFGEQHFVNSLLYIKIPLKNKTALQR